MTEEKQIEEMARIIQNGELARNRGALDCTEFSADLVLKVGLQRLAGAKALLNEGYRKQSVGEWIDTGDFELDNIYSGWKCSLCGHIFCGNKTNFCSNCGAKMKGE